MRNHAVWLDIGRVCKFVWAQYMWHILVNIIVLVVSFAIQSHRINTYTAFRTLRRLVLNVRL